MTDSCCCTAEINTIWQSNYIPIKKIKVKKIFFFFFLFLLLTFLLYHPCADYIPWVSFILEVGKVASVSSRSSSSHISSQQTRVRSIPPYPKSQVGSWVSHAWLTKQVTPDLISTIYPRSEPSTIQINRLK